MKTKQGQRVAYYEVTGKSENCTAKVDVGGVLVDRPRGPFTSWDFINTETGESSWIAAKRVGFARIGDVPNKPIPEPGLAAYLESRKTTEALTRDH